MGNRRRTKEKPAKRIDWGQTVADAIASFLVGLILLIIDRLIR